MPLKTMRTRLIAAQLLLFVLTGLAFAQSTANPALTEAVRRETFDRVWSTINDKHYDPTFGGVDWKAVRIKYEPLALAETTPEAFHAVLRKMIGELKLSHFAIFPSSDPTAATGNGTIGVEISMIDDKPAVVRVRDGSPAASKLRPGSVVESIDGKPIAELLAPLERSLADRGVNDRLREVYRERTVAALIDGKPGSKVVIGYSDAAGKNSAEFERVSETREMSEALGNFPPQPVIFESRMLPDNVGYIRFNMWVIPQMAKLREAIRGFSGAKGIVFDLRGNPGGVGGMASGVAGLLSDRQFSLGSMNGRGSEIKFLVFPQKNPFLGKVVIISDHGTGSTSEIFAAGIQEAGRGVVVGETSAGAVLPSVFEKLPTGWLFQYAISDYRSPNDVLIEGRGVKPDIESKQTIEALRAGRDLPLETALLRIKNGKGK